MNNTSTKVTAVIAAGSTLFVIGTFLALYLQNLPVQEKTDPSLTIENHTLTQLDVVASGTIATSEVDTSLFGSDQDNDGVWDEAEIAIEQLYMEDPDLRAIQRLGAVALQETILAGAAGSDQEVLDAASVGSEWVSCLVQLRHRDGHNIAFTNTQIAQLKSVILNSPSRHEANRRSELILSGSEIDIPGITLDECTNRFADPESKTPTLPPDPGEAGKATLAGIDSDGDDVRDDVQRWIAFSFPEQPNIRAGLKQYAIPLQHALLDAESEELALIHTDTMDRAQDCLKAIVGLERKDQYTNQLRVQMLNTKERSRAYIKYDSQLGEHVFHLLDASLDMCDFEVSSLQ